MKSDVEVEKLNRKIDQLVGRVELLQKRLGQLENSTVTLRSQIEQKRKLWLYVRIFTSFDCWLYRLILLNFDFINRNYKSQLLFDIDRVNVWYDRRTNKSYYLYNKLKIVIWSLDQTNIRHTTWRCLHSAFSST